MEYAKSASRPISTAERGDQVTGIHNEKRASQYRGIVGSVLYSATKIKTDIYIRLQVWWNHSFPVQRYIISKQFERNKTADHDSATGLEQPTIRFCGYEMGHRPWRREKSLSWILIFHRNASVHISSVMQQVTALRTFDANHMALSETTLVASLLRYVCRELDSPQKPWMTYKDNKETVNWTYGGHMRHYTRWKQIDIRYHFVLDMVNDRRITVKRKHQGHFTGLLRKRPGQANFHYAMKTLNVFTYNHKG